MAKDAIDSPFDYSQEWLDSRGAVVLPQPEYLLNSRTFVEQIARILKDHRIDRLAGAIASFPQSSEEAVFEFAATGEDIAAYRELTWVRNTIVLGNDCTETFGLLCTPEYSLYAASRELLEEVFLDLASARDAFLDYDDWTVTRVANSIRKFERYLDWT